MIKNTEVTYDSLFVLAPGDCDFMCAEDDDIFLEKFKDYTQYFMDLPKDKNLNETHG